MVLITIRSQNCCCLSMINSLAKQSTTEPFTSSKTFFDMDCKWNAISLQKLFTQSRLKTKILKLQRQTLSKREI